MSQDGTFQKCFFDPVKGGECKRESFSSVAHEHARAATHNALESSHACAAADHLQLVDATHTVVLKCPLKRYRVIKVLTLGLLGTQDGH